MPVYIGTLLKVVNAADRILAVRSLLYLSLGTYEPGMDELDIMMAARENVFLLLELGVYESTVELLRLEMERGRGSYEGARANITIADNLSLRGVCVCVFTYIFINVYSMSSPILTPQ